MQWYQVKTQFELVPIPQLNIRRMSVCVWRQLIYNVNRFINLTGGAGAPSLHRTRWAVRGDLFQLTCHQQSVQESKHDSSPTYSPGGLLKQDWASLPGLVDRGHASLCVSVWECSVWYCLVQIQPLTAVCPKVAGEIRIVWFEIRFVQWDHVCWAVFRVFRVCFWVCSLPNVWPILPLFCVLTCILLY